jgi:hypothetical protein
MRFAALTEEERTAIANRAAELIDTFSQKDRFMGLVIPPNLMLCESCRELILDLPLEWADVLKSQDSDGIEQWRRNQATWYHQLRSEEETFGFVRSIEEPSPEGRTLRVIEVVPSAVASEFQATINRMDSDQEEAVSDEGEEPVVLLHVPRLRLYGLAVHREERISWVYPFFRPVSFHFFREGRNLEDWQLDRKELVDLLYRLDS